jgi:hypothetical protein
MTEYQKIADGLLSMTHPEIHLFKTQAAQVEADSGDGREPMRRPGPAVAAVRAVKFAFAALVAGSRAIPLGDNGCITRQLGEYGSHLKGC